MNRSEFPFVRPTHRLADACLGRLVTALGAGRHFLVVSRAGTVLLSTEAQVDVDVFGHNLWLAPGPLRMLDRPATAVAPSTSTTVMRATTASCWP